MPVVTATVSSLDVPYTQIGNTDPNGVQLGATNTPVGFFGATPIIQPTSGSSLDGIPGTVTAYAVTVTALSVAPNTSAEQTFTVTGVATGQVVQVTKPTSQAGLAVVGMRVSATNTVGITYANDTAATITPTAGETYAFDAIPAPMVITAALTPAAVAPNSFVQQQFSVGGLAANSPVIVNKPTAQAGLGIVDATMVSAGVVGITFANFTAATITPTAAETYSFFAAAAISLAAVFRSFTQTLTPVSVAANTTAEQTFTVPGLPANSQVVVNKPSQQAGLGIGGVRVSALNTLAINFINNTAAAIVPPSELYTIGSFPAVLAAAGSSTAFNGEVGGGTADHAALVALGLVGGP